MAFSKAVMSRPPGRALDEPIGLNDTVKRLYNNNTKSDFSEVLEQAVLANVRQSITADTVFAVDHTDISKKYAKKMENLAVVRDGDAGTFGLGYNQVVITATQPGEANPTIMANTIFSKTATPDATITGETQGMLSRIRAEHGSSGVRTCDRFFDSKSYYKFFTAADEDYVIRAKTNRRLFAVSNNRIVPDKQDIVTLAEGCKTPLKCQVKKWKNGEWQSTVTVKVGSRKVFLPCINKIITLVVVKGFGKIPMMLLTNIDVSSKNLILLQRILQIYRARWACEEYIRFVKASYTMEDVRCLCCQALKNTLAFLTFANDFVTRHLGRNEAIKPMRIKILARAQAVFEDHAKLHLYRLCAGIECLLQSIPAGYRQMSSNSKLNLQLELLL